MSDIESPKRLCTGSEYVSIPNIEASSGAIHDIGFVHNGFRACIEIHGSDQHPFLAPFVTCDGVDVLPGVESSGHTPMSFERVAHWIPSFTFRTDDFEVIYTIVAPLERRGFACIISIINSSACERQISAGWRTCWSETRYVAGLSKPVLGAKRAYIRTAGPTAAVLECAGHIPLFAISMIPDESCSVALSTCPNEMDASEPLAPECVHFDLLGNYVSAPRSRVDIPLYVGVGLEEVSATASANELLLQGWTALFTTTCNWLKAKVIHCNDKRIEQILNLNSFYNYFYSQATTLDTEAYVVLTARSSRNDFSGVYRDRDAMRWSLPAVIQVSWAQGRKMLIYGFTTQLNNVGMHSRFIDGIAMEPGMQLDQLCGPIRALHSYVELSGDLSILFDQRVQTGINRVQQVLAAQRHPSVALFETLLGPSGTHSKYPFVCYSNMLVCRILEDISTLYGRIRDIDRADEAFALAQQVRKDILKHFVVQGPYGMMFAGAVDLEGAYELSDDPAGSLQLATYLQFCSPEDHIYKNTVAWIHSEHNAHVVARKYNSLASACHGSTCSLPSLVNDLLTGHKRDALHFLATAGLDDGIGCTAVDSATGQASSGFASASCAGYLAFGLRTAIGASLPQTAIVHEKERPSEALYHPPPKTSLDTRKARL